MPPPTRKLPAKASPLHYACFYGESDILADLLKQKVFDIDGAAAANVNRSTPLHFATEHNHYDCVKLLLNAGARTDVFDFETPLHTAFRHNFFDVAQLLLDGGASPDIKDQEGRSVMEMQINAVMKESRQESLDALSHFEKNRKEWESQSKHFRQEQQDRRRRRRRHSRFQPIQPIDRSSLDLGAS